VSGGGLIRVFIVDDHPIVRAGLGSLLSTQPDMQVVGEARDGLEALQRVAASDPHVVMMDLSMPRLPGVEATRRLIAAHPHLGVLALTAHEDRGYARLALDAGAKGFLLKHAAGDDVVRAIRVVAAGGLYLDPAVAAHVVSTRRPEARPAPDLSERETEVLRLIAEGHGMKEIAARLELSTRTLETYRARAMEKLELTTRAEIVRYALLRGWLQSR
jgi:DNA-binding NarL/FixJ family response regulator